MPYALILFIVIPILEIALLLNVGDEIGWVPTLLIVIATAIVGSAMLRQQGLATLNRARQRLDSGEMPAQQLLEGMLIMIGGILLLTPGFVTDAFGFVCLIPMTRQWIATRMSTRAVVGFSVGGQPRPGGTVTPGHTTRPNSRGETSQRDTGDIFDGDFKRLDDD